MGQISLEKNVGGIEGLCVITPAVHGDERGYFMETYNVREMQEAGFDIKFVQDNQSMSVKGVLRGLHFQKQFPQGKLAYVITNDTTVFVGASLNEVYHTLAEAGLLVLVVVFLFLQSWRATLIPMLAVPVSLIGTMAGLWLFGFSLNTLTLFAMTLSIGIVVDDAIVVLENVERLMRTEKLSPFDEIGRAHV